MSFYYNDNSKTDFGKKKLKWVTFKPNRKSVPTLQIKSLPLPFGGRTSEAPTELFLPRHFDMDKALVLTDKLVLNSIPKKPTGRAHEVFTMKDSKEGGNRLFIFNDHKDKKGYHFALIVERKGKKSWNLKKLKELQKDIITRVRKEENPLRFKGLVWQISKLLKPKG